MSTPLQAAGSYWDTVHAPHGCRLAESSICECSSGCPWLVAHGLCSFRALDVGAEPPVRPELGECGAALKPTLIAWPGSWGIGLARSICICSGAGSCPEGSEHSCLQSTEQPSPQETRLSADVQPLSPCSLMRYSCWEAAPTTLFSLWPHDLVFLFFGHRNSPSATCSHCWPCQHFTFPPAPSI